MRYSKGFGLIEVVVGAAIITASVLALIDAYNTYATYALNNSRNIQAALLAEEGIEAVKFLRDNSWSVKIAPLASTSVYYLSWNAGAWNLTTTTQSYVDGMFLRTLLVAAVNRDASSQDIVLTGGTTDPYTKKITVNVEYPTSKGTTTRSVSAYITNLFSN